MRTYDEILKEIPKEQIPCKAEKGACVYDFGKIIYDEVIKDIKQCLECLPM